MQDSEHQLRRIPERLELSQAEFQRFYDVVGTRAREAGMTEEVLQGLLSSVLFPTSFQTPPTRQAFALDE